MSDDPVDFCSDDRCMIPTGYVRQHRPEIDKTTAECCEDGQDQELHSLVESLVVSGEEENEVGTDIFRSTIGVFIKKAEEQHKSTVDNRTSVWA